ncbi:MAG: hypothetical protein COB02_05090 [Candidatus Cloacimonadota bacterium]|nr:MAG: hypothetical protein COB02_05090 [Candidatus Cloacimonadota bacterium]
MLKNLLFYLLFISISFANPVIQRLHQKFSFLKQDNQIYIFQSKHKKFKLNLDDIKKNALGLIQKLHKWKIPSIHIIQVLHIQGLPKFTPKKALQKKLRYKIKHFNLLMKSLLNKEELITFKNIKFYWYIDRKKKTFKDLNLDLSSNYLFIKSQSSDFIKTTIDQLKVVHFHK